MWPFLFDLSVAGLHLRPPTYGVLLALAFSAAYFESLRLAKREGESPKHIENLFLIIVLSSVVGARMFHVVFEDPGYYWRNPGEIIAVWNGGYTLYGAFLLAFACGTFYTVKKRIDFRQFADIAAPGVALGIGIGRLGCFFAGCCWGTPSSAPWAVVFDHPLAFTESRFKGVPLHPTQLYESFGAFLLYAILVWTFTHRRFRGQVMLYLLFGYSALRFLVEYFRADQYRGFVFGGLLSTSQFISLLISLAALGTALYFYRKSPPRT